MDVREFRSLQPLSDAEFAEIRRAVLVKTATRTRSMFALRFAFAAMVVAAMVMMWPRRREVVAPMVTTQQVVIPAQPVVQVAERRPEAAGPAGRRPALHKPPAQHVAMRMELQTSDPDIRIIWITN
jgi:hypothetical protein